jgi:hypothetical protein
LMIADFRFRTPLTLIRLFSTSGWLPSQLPRTKPAHNSHWRCRIRQWYFAAIPLDAVPVIPAPRPPFRRSKIID